MPHPIACLPKSCSTHEPIEGFSTGASHHAARTVKRRQRSLWKRMATGALTAALLLFAGSLHADEAKKPAHKPAKGAPAESKETKEPKEAKDGATKDKDAGAKKGEPSVE